MTISSTANRNDYTGNDTTATYAYSYRVFINTDFIVTARNTTTDVESTLTLTTDYTVTGVGLAAGGTIVLAGTGKAWQGTGAFLDTGYELTIRRVVGLTQITDIRNQGDFFPEIHEDVFDKSLMIDQQQQDELDRSVKLPETIASSDFDTTIPADIVGANSLALVSNAAGTAFEVGPSVADISGANASAVAAAASAAAALVSENAAAADAVLTDADATATAADVVSTNADVVSTNADVVSAAASEAAAGISETNASASSGVASTKASEAAADAVLTAADVVITNADVVLTNADVVSCAASAAAALANATWTKVTIGYAALTAASLTTIIEGYELGAKGTIHSILMKHNTVFAGTAVTALKLDLGIAGEEDRFISLFDTFATVAESAKDSTNLVFIGNLGSVTSIKLQATAVGANLDQLTQGSVDIYFFKRDLP